MIQPIFWRLDATARPVQWLRGAAVRDWSCRCRDADIAGWAHWSAFADWSQNWLVDQCLCLILSSCRFAAKWDYISTSSCWGLALSSDKLMKFPIMVDSWPLNSGDPLTILFVLVMTLADACNSLASWLTIRSSLSFSAERYSHCWLISASCIVSCSLLFCTDWFSSYRLRLTCSKLPTLYRSSRKWWEPWLCDCNCDCDCDCSSAINALWRSASLFRVRMKLFRY